MINSKPLLGAKEINSFISEQYGIKAQCTELDGERDQNFLVETADDNKYVLKLINPAEENIFVEAQNDVLVYLAGKVSLCPRIVTDRHGHYLSILKTGEGMEYRARMLTWFDGEAFGSMKLHPGGLLGDIGKKLGSIDSALAGYDHPGFKREFIWDLSAFERIVATHRSLVSDSAAGSFIDKTMEEYHNVVKPKSAGLRRSVIHNDANDYNIIISPGDGREGKQPGMAGLIDFGDMVHSYTVANAAVAMAYIMLGKKEPLRDAATFLSAYHKSFALTESEVEVIFTMARMRLVLSVCIGALQQGERPSDEYLGISQQAIRDLIPVLESIHPLFAETVFRHACDMDAAPWIRSLHPEIKERAREAFPLMGEKMAAANCMVLDLGVAGRLIDGDPDMNTAGRLGERIGEELVKEKKKFGIGRFAEARILYSSPVFQQEQFTRHEDRTIHLGIDIFAAEGTPVYAPLDASVHLFKYNPGELDYGHMIILRHYTPEGREFYTLYGHLAKKSLDGLVKGQKIKRGDIFAYTGNVSENGGWSPHLHFQVLADLMDYGTDVPGVCKPWEENAWKILSPDPGPFLDIPPELFPQQERTAGETLQKRKEFFAANLGLSYDKPLKIVRGWMQYLFDEKGQKYLDAYNNVPHIGHCHPEITEAACGQMKILNTNTRYLADQLNDFATLLLSTFSKPLEVCFFLNSASEANELALRLAFAFTGRKDLVVLEGAYHGNTNTLIDISPYKHDGPGGSGTPSWVHKAPVPDCYRGEYKYGEKEAGPKYAAFIDEISRELKKNGRAPAAFIAETCPSVGGQIIFPPGYLEEVYRIIRENGGVCIADEVQTAYGRMGTSFYAFEDQGVTPDIVVLGKPIGNGHPLAAVICRRDIAEAFNTGMEFFSTFGGNTVSVAVGRKMLEIVLRDNYMEHARETGAYLLEQLKTFTAKYPVVGDVRGSGLFMGIELVRDPLSLEPAGAEAAYIIERLREMRILAGTDGPYNNVLKIRPPMVFDRYNADILVRRLSYILENLPFGS
jgi:4-aminobutyrate aminotransferase-like enzyme/Ser/Thr protein kinase RdoA (MazF antagonist)